MFMSAMEKKTLWSFEPVMSIYIHHRGISPEGRDQSATKVWNKRKKRKGYHESPLGGKAEACFPPSDVIRMNFIVLRLDQSPFHRRRAATTSSLVTSGNQNPVFSSLFSVSVRWRRTSSRFAGGRPLRRSCCNCSISGTSRLMYLRASSQQMRTAGSCSISSYLVTISRMSSSETVLDSSGMPSWK